MASFEGALLWSSGKHGFSQVANCVHLLPLLAKPAEVGAIAAHLETKQADLKEQAA